MPGLAGERRGTTPGARRQLRGDRGGRRQAEGRPPGDTEISGEDDPGGTEGTERLRGEPVRGRGPSGPIDRLRDDAETSGDPRTPRGGDPTPGRPL
ncbi:hypothetical protein NDU88_001288 [Pleurodeles waltl]|uniref:Uncharacterized protein n=1 Tax=Pleurodeles waltl TaxID=8319 RepID=A0AAV7TJ92_PLEWA|nr:hypothetical protein NDU88_001288 [Pleurodeles waltl]